MLLDIGLILIMLKYVFLMYRKGNNNPTHMSWASNVKNAFAVN